jgi:hypothetical protein
LEFESFLVFPIIKINMQMNPGTLVPLESVGTVYPDIRRVDEWGILTVTKGALIKSDFSKIYVSASPNLSAPLTQGAGWTVKAGERKGDHVVRKLEL